MEHLKPCSQSFRKAHESSTWSERKRITEVNTGGECKVRWGKIFTPEWCGLVLCSRVSVCLRVRKERKYIYIYLKTEAKSKYTRTCMYKCVSRNLRWLIRSRNNPENKWKCVYVKQRVPRTIIPVNSSLYVTGCGGGGKGHRGQEEEQRVGRNRGAEDEEGGTAIHGKKN